MGRRHISLGTLLWIAIGIIVAASHHFFDNLNTVSTVGSAVLAILAWPLVLLNVHIAI
jgi:hypothetical protein